MRARFLRTVLGVRGVGFFLLGLVMLACGGAGAADAQEAGAATTTAGITQGPAQKLSAGTERVQVLAFRSPVAELESPVSSRLLSAERLRQAAGVGLDTKLRTVPGFDLFRRSSSLVANPTTEGVSLRGLGSTAASRTLVLLGDVPLNDPYGGWVHWEELPSLAIGQVEVVRGGVSDLYGSSAMGGVVQISTVPLVGGGGKLVLHSGRSPVAQDDKHTGADGKSAGASGDRWRPELVLESGDGAEALNDNGARLRAGRGRWSGMAAGGLLGTDGYVLVAPNLRGPVDVRSNVHAENGLILVERRLGPGADDRAGGSSSGGATAGDVVWLRGNVLNEDRSNGTPLTTNATRLWRYAAGLDSARPGTVWGGLAGDWQLRGWGSTERYRQGFSSIAAGRGGETLTRRATDPANELGAALRWLRGFTPEVVALAGTDVRDVRAQDIERPTAAGAAATSTTARQTDVGTYGELLWTPGPWLISGSARLDHFENADAATYLLSSGAKTKLPSIVQTVFDPRLGVSRRIGSGLAVNASAYRAYRAPTQNELYRTGQVGQQTTLANPNLRAERATGWEIGLNGERPQALHASWRASYFWTEVNRPVTALTLTTTPTATTLMRENLGQIRSRGVSVDGSVHPAGWLEVTGGYQFARATVTRFTQASLIGNWIPQVPRNTGTLQVTAQQPRLGLLSVQARTSGRQYDDDANTYVLHSFVRFDVYASRTFGQRWQVFGAVENLLDRSVDVGRTPIRTLGTPQLARFGVRVTLR